MANGNGLLHTDTGLCVRHRVLRAQCSSSRLGRYGKQFPRLQSAEQEMFSHFPPRVTILVVVLIMQRMFSFNLAATGPPGPGGMTMHVKMRDESK